MLYASPPLGFPGDSVVKNLPANAGDTGHMVQSLGWEDPLQKEMATCSNILAWKIPWTVESGKLESKGQKKSQL